MDRLEDLHIDIVGKGKVGKHLFSLLNSLPHESGTDVRLIDSRTFENLRKGSDIILVSVADEAIPEVISRLTGCNGIIAHTSGSTPIGVLNGKKGGVFYPFQSFADGVDVDFSEIPIMIEATDPDSLATLHLLAEKIGSPVFECDSNRRKELHICGVISCNFVNELIAIAQERLASAGLPPEIIDPLVRKTVDKALRYGGANVRTGPASRGDRKVIREHEEILAGNPPLLRIYHEISEIIGLKCKNQ